MQGSSKSHQDILEPHIPPGEKLQEYHVGERETGDIRIVAVTDRRLIVLNQNIVNEQKQVSVESVLLTSKHIAGTTYSRNEQKDSGIDKRVGGAILTVAGSLVAFYSLIEDLGEFGELAILVGAGAALVGIAMIIEAEDKVKGQVSLTIHRSGIEDKIISFPPGATEVPRTISKTVSEIHD